MKASEIQAPVTYVFAKALNDVNGNPRRVFVIQYTNESGQPTTCVADDGYSGENWIHYRRQAGLQTTCLCEIQTTPGEYKRLLKRYTRIENA